MRKLYEKFLDWFQIHPTEDFGKEKQYLSLLLAAVMKFDDGQIYIENEFLQAVLDKNENMYLDIKSDENGMTLKVISADQQ